jgi:hypothetical protein
MSRPEINANAADEIAAIEGKIANIRKAIEEGLADANWANSRLREPIVEKRAVEPQTSEPSRVDAETVLTYIKNIQGLFQQAEPPECKRLLRKLVKGVKLLPERLEVEIAYEVPELVMNRVVAGDGFEPPTFGYEVRWALVTNGNQRHEWRSKSLLET